MRHLILICIVLLAIFILSDDKQFVKKVMGKLYKNRSVQLLMLLVMFYLVYNNYPLIYTIPFAGLLFLAMFGGKMNWHELFNQKLSHFVEGFKSVLDQDDEEDDHNRTIQDHQEVEDQWEQDEQDHYQEEDDKSKRLDELLDQMDQQFEVMEEAHKDEM